MTFPGKLLAVLNFLLSLVFMAFAAFVFNSHVDWKAKVVAKEKLVAEANTAKQNAETTSSALDKRIKELEEQLKTEKKQATDAADLLNKQVNQLKSDLDRSKKEGTTANSTGQTMMVELQQRNDEVLKLRDMVQNFSKDLTKVQSERADLEDQNSNLKDEKARLQRRNEQLADRLDKVDRFLAEKKIALNMDQIPDPRAAKPAPNIEGVVTRVQDDGKLITISLGTDDGVHEGQEFQVWRQSDLERKYLGKIKIFAARPNESAATVDSSSGTIRPDDRVGVQIIGMK